MADNYQGEGIPVFLINGFLESGKTSFIQYTMNQDYFKRNTIRLRWQSCIQRQSI